MKMRWVAFVGVLMVGFAIRIWHGDAYGLVFAGIGLFFVGRIAQLSTDREV